MRPVIIFFFLLVPLVLPAQTEVSGAQNGTWTADGSPYYVTGHVTVPQGQTLVIEPGVRVEFRGRYRIYVEGRLRALGTATDSIIFTATDRQSGWAGIRLNGTPDISEFHYCRFEYGKTSANGSYPDQHGGAVAIVNADARFFHCVFEHNDATGDDDGMGGAVYCMNTGSADQTLTRFEDCTFRYNHSYGEGGAIKFTNDGHTQLIRCHFIGNSTGYGGGALFFYTAEGVLISQCSFYENTSSYSGGGAIKTLNPQTSLRLVNCTFTQNHAQAYAEGGAVNLNYADAEFINCIIYNNTQQYGKDVHIGQNASAVFRYCDVDLPDGATGEHNLDNVDPLFVDASRGDLHLQENSPCIDAGTDVGLPYTGNAPDLGCFEYGMTAVDKEGRDVFALYPVPARNSLTVRLLHDGKARVRIFDLQGQLITDRTFDRPLRIDVSGWAPGTYVLQLITGHYRYRRTFTVK